MLNKLRNDIAHNKLVRLVLVIITLAFVFWGMGLSGLSFNKNYAIKVGEAEVTPTEFHRAYQLAKQQISQQFQGQELSPELMKLFGVEKQITQELTSQALLEAYAKDENIQISNKTVFELIKNEKAFQKDGKFDKETYKAVLAQAQLTALEYEATLVKNIQANIIAIMFNQAIVVSDDELEMQVKHAQERRDADILTIKATDLAGLPKPTDEELEAIYNKQIDNFKIAEKRSFKLLVVSKDALAKEQTVTAEEIKQYFEEHSEEFFTKPEFKVQQILVKDKETADKVLALADLSENFNKYVTEYSTDKVSKVKNGDMGWLTGDIFGAEFENAINSAKKGDVAHSAIKSVFGYHIFKLNEIKESKLKSFDEVKDKIKADLIANKAEEALDEKINTTLDMVSAGEKLDNIAKELGFKLQNFTDAKANGPQDYIKDVFETALDEVSQPIELDFGSTGFVQVTDIKDESVKPLEKVKGLLTTTFEQEKTAELLQAKADEVLAAIQENKLSFKDAVKQFKLSAPIKSVVSIARIGDQKKEVSADVAKNMFETATNTVVNKTLHTENDILIVKVLGSYQEEISDANKEKLRQALVMQKTNDLYYSFVDALRKEHKVKVNQALIDQIIKQN
ncbi:MAG TPA: hypothetical protein DCL21_01705 [Alphaproteobacteria bacterium]|nr:hypothetical protein [Alphaproteobacteria bacterium]